MSRALLLAEAEPGTRDFLQRHLAREGFEVLGADVQDLALESLAYADSASASALPQVHFSISFGVPLSGAASH